jgi:thioredoxin reductase (NADPH)
MARSILLRGFDRQIAGYIQANMEAKGIKFILNCTPTSITKLEDGTPPTLQVTSKSSNGIITGKYNTVLVAVGRDAATEGLNLENAGVIFNPQNRRIPTDKYDQTNVKHIYAIGDVADNRPELTPVAIKSGLLLARRLFGGKRALMDYTRVPTTIYTQVEYSCVGMSEDEAIEKYGESRIEVYHTTFTPLEYQLPMKTELICYIKIITLKAEKERIVGFHYVGPNAGEVCQGFALAIRLGARKSDLDATCGIHPTNAETTTSLTITKSSGQQAVHTAC